MAFELAVMESLVLDGGHLDISIGPLGMITEGGSMTATVASGGSMQISAISMISDSVSASATVISGGILDIAVANPLVLPMVVEPGPNLTIGVLTGGSLTLPSVLQMQGVAVSATVSVASGGSMSLNELAMRSSSALRPPVPNPH